MKFACSCPDQSDGVIEIKGAFNMLSLGHIFQLLKIINCFAHYVVGHLPTSDSLLSVLCERHKENKGKPKGKGKKRKMNKKFAEDLTSKKHRYQ